MNEFRVSVEGFARFEEVMREFKRRSRGEFVIAANEQAKTTQAKIKAAAPASTGRRKSGGLRRAIKMIKAKDEAGRDYSIVYISRRYAPHLHLVIFGSSNRFRKGGSIFTPAGRRYVKKFDKPAATGQMPPNPFFRQVVETEIPNYMNLMTRHARIVLDDIDRLLQGKGPSKRWKR